MSETVSPIPEGLHSLTPHLIVNDARKAISEEAPLDRLRSLTSELQQVYHSLRPAAGDGGGAGQGDTGGADEASGGQGGDDVIDAEFTTRQ